VCCTCGCITDHRDSRFHCITLKGALFTLHIKSDSRVHCVAFMNSLFTLTEVRNYFSICCIKYLQYQILFLIKVIFCNMFLFLL